MTDADRETSGEAAAAEQQPAEQQPAEQQPAEQQPAEQARGPSRQLPPDPAAYDTERNQVARQKGLPTSYIPGGEDPDQARAAAEDRRYLRLLLAMVIVIVLAGFVLGVIAALTGFTTLVGDPG
jgi:hypothetical protein